MVMHRQSVFAATTTAAVVVVVVARTALIQNRLWALSTVAIAIMVLLVAGALLCFFVAKLINARVFLACSRKKLSFFLLWPT